jgi:hypothetical protein
LPTLGTTTFLLGSFSVSRAEMGVLGFISTG